MKAIFVMYDSLRRDMLPCYGGAVADLPNFKRLAEHTVTFDNSYVGSLPCMPARRELQTGRLNFLHRSWGPMEPYDISMPEILDRNGIHSHLATDHYHYVQDGGATYQGRFSSWACYRGQESDAWIGSAAPEQDISHIMGFEDMPPALQQMRSKGAARNAVNRSVIHGEAEYPQTLTFDDGLDFVKRNAQYDNWFVQIETFDPHEPFDAPENFEAKYFDPADPFQQDWPPYAKVKQSPEEVEKMRKKYFALLEFCDKSMGRVLDMMDELDLWKDTMLIVGTDHGFMLGEHDWWGKGSMPDYDEIVHTPMFLWDPRNGICKEHRSGLVQTMDIPATVLDFFDLPIPDVMDGRPLRIAVEQNESLRPYGLFGYHGGTMGITDGRYVYLRAPVVEDPDVTEYTLMPTKMIGFAPLNALRQAKLVPGFSFTQGLPLLAYPGQFGRTKMPVGTDLLFDTATDPHQQHPIDDPARKEELCRQIARIMLENEAPEELYPRFGLTNPTV